MSQYKKMLLSSSAALLVSAIMTTNAMATDHIEDNTGSVTNKTSSASTNNNAVVKEFKEILGATNLGTTATPSVTEILEAAKANPSGTPSTSETSEISSEQLAILTQSAAPNPNAGRNVAHRVVTGNMIESAFTPSSTNTSSNLEDLGEESKDTLKSNSNPSLKSSSPEASDDEDEEENAEPSSGSGNTRNDLDNNDAAVLAKLNTDIQNAKTVEDAVNTILKYVPADYPQDDINKIQQHGTDLQESDINAALRSSENVRELLDDLSTKCDILTQHKLIAQVENDRKASLSSDDQKVIAQYLAQYFPGFNIDSLEEILSTIKVAKDFKLNKLDNLTSFDNLNNRSFSTLIEKYDVSQKLINIFKASGLKELRSEDNNTIKDLPGYIVNKVNNLDSDALQSLSNSVEDTLSELKNNKNDNNSKKIAKSFKSDVFKNEIENTRQKIIVAKVESDLTIVRNMFKDVKEKVSKLNETNTDASQKDSINNAMSRVSRLNIDKMLRDIGAVSNEVLNFKRIHSAVHQNLNSKNNSVEQLKDLVNTSVSYQKASGIKNKDFKKMLDDVNLINKFYNNSLILSATSKFQDQVAQLTEEKVSLVKEMKAKSKESEEKITDLDASLVKASETLAEATKVVQQFKETIDSMSYLYRYGQVSQLANQAIHLELSKGLDSLIKGQEKKKVIFDEAHMLKPGENANNYVNSFRQSFVTMVGNAVNTSPITPAVNREAPKNTSSVSNVNTVASSSPSVLNLEQAKKFIDATQSAFGSGDTPVITPAAVTNPVSDVVNQTKASKSQVSDVVKTPTNQIGLLAPRFPNNNVNPRFNFASTGTNTLNLTADNNKKLLPSSKSDDTTNFFKSLSKERLNKLESQVSQLLEVKSIAFDLETFQRGGALIEKKNCHYDPVTNTLNFKYQKSDRSGHLTPLKTGSIKL